MGRPPGIADNLRSVAHGSDRSRTAPPPAEPRAAMDRARPHDARGGPLRHRRRRSARVPALLPVFTAHLRAVGPRREHDPGRLAARLVGDPAALRPAGRPARDAASSSGAGWRWRGRAGRWRAWRAATWGVLACVVALRARHRRLPPRGGPGGEPDLGRAPGDRPRLVHGRRQRRLRRRARCWRRSFIPLLDERATLVFLVPGRWSSPPGSTTSARGWRCRWAAPHPRRRQGRPRRRRSGGRIVLLLVVTSMRTWTQFCLLALAPLLLADDRGFSEQAAGLRGGGLRGRRRRRHPGRRRARRAGRRAADAAVDACRSWRRSSRCFLLTEGRGQHRRVRRRRLRADGLLLGHRRDGPGLPARTASRWRPG